jgi:hypothetical protein
LRKLVGGITIFLWPIQTFFLLFAVPSARGFHYLNGLYLLILAVVRVVVDNPGPGGVDAAPAPGVAVRPGAQRSQSGQPSLVAQQGALTNLHRIFSFVRKFRTRKKVQGSTKKNPL